ncbi:MAG: response regulator transcription factor [Lachnospiraceae bacterium]|nr:response regulator transcription factor [Lachnospiraceae bacterium]
MNESSQTEHHILIIEDDVTLAGGLCRALQNEGTETLYCTTLGEARELLEKQQTSGEQYTLVLLDVNLPDGNGFDFLQEIKNKYDICVIMLTANDMETDIVAGLNAGADDYITKPFSLAVLRARVDTQLRRVAQSRAAVDSARGGYAAAGSTVNDGTLTGIWETEQDIVIDDYSFNFSQMLFKHGKERIELSKSEQKLLRVFIENRGITLTREKLLDHIWSVDAEFVDENTLSVTVKRLRDKLGAQDRIRTVYGIGYRWE